MQKDYDIVGGYNNQRVPNIDSERSVNLFEYIDPLGKKPKSLLPTSGLVNTNFNLTPAEGGFRTQFVFNGNEYSVVGSVVFRRTTSNTISVIGIIDTTAGFVGVDANTFQVIFVDGLNGWVWDTIASTFTKITDVNFPTNPIDVTYLDGFFVVAAGGTNTFVLSQFNDGTNYSPLQQGAVTSHPGTIVACRTLHRRLFLFSQNFTEVWENAGVGSNLPFRRNNNLLMEVGTPAIGSIATGFDTMFFLSQDEDGLGSVIAIQGTESAQKAISTRAIDFTLASYAADPTMGVADANGIFVKENGLMFYRINFTKANHTFVFNATLSSQEQGWLWHEEEVLNGDRHPAQTHSFFNGINYYGDYKSPIMYIVDNTVSTNNGEAIRRMRIGKPVVPEGYERIRVDRFHLDLQQGNIAEANETLFQIDLLAEDGLSLLTENNIVIILEQGDLVEEDIDPVVFLSISKDGGQTYGFEIKAPMGLLGDRTFRTVWRKLGTTKRGQAFVPKIQFFNNIPFVILGAAWSFEMLPE